MVKLIIGLGNPGEKYQKTYHNAGIIALDELAGKDHQKTDRWQRASFKHFEFKEAWGLILVKPKSLMNESGVAAKEALTYFRLKPDSLLLMHDDSDLMLGKYKFSFGRGSAGHKGVQSVMRHLKTKNFWRLRIGIRKVGGKSGRFVLKNMPEKDRDILNKIVDASIKEAVSLRHKV